MSEEQPRLIEGDTGEAGVGAGVEVGDEGAIPGTLRIAKGVVGVGVGHIAGAVDVDSKNEEKKQDGDERAVSVSVVSHLIKYNYIISLVNIIREV